MTWEQALRQIQNDTRFKMITKISEKKRLFNEWKIQQQKEERVSLKRKFSPIFIFFRMLANSLFERPKKTMRILYSMTLVFFQQ
jgi:hypothetical protein